MAGISDLCKRCSRPGLPDFDRWETPGAVEIQGRIDHFVHTG